MNTDSLQQGSIGKTTGFFTALWPTLFWIVIMTIIMTIARPDWRSPDTAHKGQIMPPAPPPATAAARPCP